MADAAEIADDAPPAKPEGKLGLVLGLVGALALGGGGFYAVYAGLVDPASLTGGVVAAATLAGAMTAAAATARRRAA